MDLALKDKRVLVSGASRGIGKSIVELFLKEGARVEFCARGMSGIEAVSGEFGLSAVGTAVDVTKPDQVSAWVAAATERMGGLDIVVPNVSALAGGGDLDLWRKAFDTDLMGSVVMVKSALSALRRSPHASIVLISSVSGREVDMFAEPYGICKAALLHYAKTLSVRHAAEGIRVNSVSPGNVYFPEGVWGDIERKQPEVFSECLAKNPLGRMATPAEVANAVVFLSSPAASFITGTNLLVDGGLTRGVQY